MVLYAHHDVQPTGDETLWNTPPFVATEIGDRIYGRGASDDKAGILVHLTALRLLGDDLGVGVVLFVEGEEEAGSPSFQNFLRTHRDKLAGDVIVVADSGNWKVGTPALTTSLRGMASLEFTVSTLDHAVHSGMYGGVVPDAALAMTRLLATLHGESGAVAVSGLGGETSRRCASTTRRSSAGIRECSTAWSSSVTDRWPPACGPSHRSPSSAWTCRMSTSPRTRCSTPCARS